MAHPSAEELKIRPLKYSDLDEAMALYAHARQYMADEGNDIQWQDEPRLEELMTLISKHEIYALTPFNADNQLAAIFAVHQGEDPSYTAPIEGAWPNSEPYVSVHRLASSGTHRKVFERVSRFALGFTGRVRIDTHAKNQSMKSALRRTGYERCGVIRLADESLRDIYYLEQ